MLGISYKIFMIGLAVFLVMQGMFLGNPMGTIMDLMWKMVSTDSPAKGLAYCVIGGVMYRPVYNGFPIPSSDDLTIAAYIGFFIAIISTKIFIDKTWRNFLATFLISFMVTWAFYRVVLANWFLQQAANLGFTNCLNEVSIGPLSFQWEWLNLVFIIGAIAGLIFIVRFTIKYMRKKDAK